MTNLYLQSDIDQILRRLDPLLEDLSGKTILLTGGRGFLGRYFMKIFEQINDGFVKKPMKIIVLDNLITSSEVPMELKQKYFQYIEHDVVDPINISEDIHYIVHAAGIASPFYYRAYPLETLDVAITGTRRMLELAKEKHAKLIFFSSSEIYGDPDPKNVPIPESYKGNVSPQGPRACYDESKRVGETLCYIYYNNYGVVTNSIRPFNVYGPGMQETDYRVLPNFASLIKAGKPLSVYGDGRQTRTFCYITDAMVGFFLVMFKGVSGEAYNIGAPTPEVSMLELVKLINKIRESDVGFNLIDYPDSYPTDEPMRRSPDIRKAKLQLGFRPEVDLDEGLRRFFTWTDQFYIGNQ